ncbi:alpha/beta fold hydrolase [Nocardioides anomalus]|uniref:alpha/beta fold hydrolase n=1 Tax=Nocardioides anomalus TaxID=2712223 RepID=UPI001E61338E|nr:alpha/beta hydrolase [Nocardioides anomalus]
MEALGAAWHFVAPDHAGFGRTPLPPGSRGGLTQWTDGAAGVMEALGFDTYAVVGHSMGGAVALALAAARPAQVERVVAVSTMGAPGAPLSPDLDALWAAPPDRSGAADMLSRLVLDQSLVTDAAVSARAEAMAAGAAAFAGVFPAPRQRWAEDLTLSPDQLTEVRAPVLLVHGAQDRVTPLREAALPLLDLLPDVRLHVLGRCGHVPALEHPRAFRHLLADFLTSP